MTMPPLPKPYAINASHQFFLEDDMRSYAAAVRAATIEECAKVCSDRSKDTPGKLPSPSAHKAEAMLCAAAIRALK